jgi:hypothetical protein
LSDDSYYGCFDYVPRQRPYAGWAAPFVTGHRYKIHWGNGNRQISSFKISLSERWTNEDGEIVLFSNFSTPIDEFKVTVDGETVIPNNTISRLDRYFG